MHMRRSDFTQNDDDRRWVGEVAKEKQQVSC